jgi:alkanesulfonate monooxygenase SsuD/methylene tetrahydromethanopterin reductase-like flavin-dependent oxidoreductase (luciferase family)
MDGSFYVEMTKALERACFDYMMLEDSSMVSDGYEGTSRVDLKFGLYAPKHDPLPLIPLLADATKHIGLVGTASTSFYPPYLLARRMATLDHLTKDGQALRARQPLRAGRRVCRPGHQAVGVVGSRRSGQGS